MKLIGVLNIQETKRELIYSSAILEEFRNVASFVFFFHTVQTDNITVSRSFCFLSSSRQISVHYVSCYTKRRRITKINPGRYFVSEL